MRKSEVYVKAKVEVIDVKALNEISALAGTCPTRSKPPCPSRK